MGRSFSPLLSLVAAVLFLFGVAALGVAAPSGTAEIASSGSAAGLPRSTVDRPDEVSGPMIHFIYALPSDGVDHAYDTTGGFDPGGDIQKTANLGAEIQFMIEWMAQRTQGLGLRIDTFQGQPDITFWRVPESTAELQASPAPVIDLRNALEAGGFSKPDTI